MNKHIMLDIETLGTRGDSAILSIGGCVFTVGEGATRAGDSEGSTFLVSIKPEFYEEFDPNNEYHVDPSTVAWWEQQGPAAKEALSINQVVTPGEALDRMDEFFQHHAFEKTFKLDGDRMWANPTAFDAVILRHAASIERTSDNDVPWHYRQETCMRTLMFLNQDKKFGDGDDTLVAHRADHDAIKQARRVQEILRG